MPRRILNTPVYKRTNFRFGNALLKHACATCSLYFGQQWNIRLYFGHSEIFKSKKTSKYLWICILYNKTVVYITVFLFYCKEKKELSNVKYYYSINCLQRDHLEHSFRNNKCDNPTFIGVRIHNLHDLKVIMAKHECHSIDAQNKYTVKLRLTYFFKYTKIKLIG